MIGIYIQEVARWITNFSIFWNLDTEKISVDSNPRDFQEKKVVKWNLKGIKVEIDSKYKNFQE